MESGSGKIVTRFAPSPTGALHIGGARTALYNWLFARKNNGKFILRIEDTDKERSKKEYENGIIESLKWLGLEWDEFYRQSERGDIYKKYIEKLITNGFAYISDEIEGDSKQVIRFKNPKKKIKFNDIVLGEIEFDTTDLGDFIIAKDTETPLYHLTVVIDDCQMGITHAIRGQEHISNTPRQILILEALGVPRPLYAHIPLILAPDRSKLSKRHGAVSTLEYRDLGYLPEALLNFIALIGWNPGGEKEVFNLKELIDEFKLERVQKAGAIFDTVKLDFINREHIKMLSEEEKLKEIIACLRRQARLPEAPKDILQKISPLILERISKWGDIDEMLKTGELQYFWQTPKYSTEILTWKNQAPAEAKKHLEQTAKFLESVENWDTEGIKSAVWDYAAAEGRGQVLWPLRVALSGRQKSPDPFMLASILGKKGTLERIGKAIFMLQ